MLELFYCLCLIILQPMTADSSSVTGLVYLEEMVCNKCTMHLTDPIWQHTESNWQRKSAVISNEIMISVPLIGLYRHMMVSSMVFHRNGSWVRSDWWSTRIKLNKTFNNPFNKATTCRKLFRPVKSIIRRLFQHAYFKHFNMLCRLATSPTHL